MFVAPLVGGGHGAVPEPRGELRPGAALKIVAMVDSLRLLPCEIWAICPMDIARNHSQWERSKGAADAIQRDHIHGECKRSQW